MASRIPAKRVQHGDAFTDEYAWLTAKDNPDVLAYLNAENAYTEEAIEGLAGLRETIFEEIRARTQESDLSVPARKGGWWYYSRTVEGQQYTIHCRRAADPDVVTPPMPSHGEPLDGEQVLLDGNEVAAGHEFFALGAFRVSPDGRLLAYATDFTGNERFTLRVKDLSTGALLDDEIPAPTTAAPGPRTARRCCTDAGRRLAALPGMAAPGGHPAADDVIVFEEPDERFRTGVGLTRSERCIVITSSSMVTSEAWLLDAATGRGATGRDAAAAGRRVRRGHQAGPDGGRLLILHNDGAETSSWRSRQCGTRGLAAAGRAPGGSPAADWPPSPGTGGRLPLGRAAGLAVYAATAEVGRVASHYTSMVEP